ncbi:MAG: YdeI/OmpD-associated family protein [Bacteroidota bacterium]
MGLKDKRVDAYIGRSAEFARPILIHLRSQVHKTCPDARETIKWGMPHFDHKGMMCSMAAFKEHCAFGFWKASLMKEHKSLFSRMGKLGMGHLGQIRSLADLPPGSVMSRMIREAARLNDEGTALAPRRKTTTAVVKTPPVLARALAGSKKAKQTFDAFSPSHKRDYVEWITEAKTEETRTRRLETAIKWMAAGKPRNWKYMK